MKKRTVKKTTPKEKAGPITDGVKLEGPALEFRTENRLVSPTPPIIVAIPNTIEKKMEAIVCTARAIESLAKSIASVNVTVPVKGCNFVNIDSPAIQVGPDES